MPPIATTNTELKPWVAPVETSYQLDYADLVTIDLSKFGHNRHQLADDLHNAIKKNGGFFGVINSGIEQTEIFQLGQSFFNDYSLESKSKVPVNFETGNYFGYKSKGNKYLFGTDVKENSEIFNIAKFNGLNDEFHDLDFVHNNYDQLSKVSHECFDIVRKLLILFAIILELDDELYFVNRHKYEDPSDDQLRYMKYHPRTPEDDSKVDNIWARAHTDFGTLTLLFNQLVVGLQIKLGDQWKYVRPVKDGIVCNVGDTLNFWSGGYFESTIHRVVRPPPDQVNKPRIGAFYFLRPGDKALIEVAHSPLLKRLGLYRETKEPIIGTDYVRKRVVDYHNRPTYEKQSNVKFKVGEFEITDGFD
ncbi:flavonol synthase [Scheffersomyces amazonensis]|uniref:flavonol synthase n=1 Tax=Scheffersomyces amazonensis TaxID=1078765 RepID=UPI00315C5D76